MVLKNSLVCGELPGVGHDGDQRGPELLHLCVAGDRVGVVEPNQVHTFLTSKLDVVNYDLNVC